MSKAYDVVRTFEAEMAKYTNSAHAVAVESCSAALFLCLIWEKMKYPDIEKREEIVLPKKTYPSVPSQCIHAGFRISFVDMEWQRQGCYPLYPMGILDCAKRIERGMYPLLAPAHRTPHICLSFHFRKSLPIDRGGMILTCEKEAAEWFKLARHDGRHDGARLHEDTLMMAGWNLTMTPIQAARGLLVMANLKDKHICPPDPYQDLSKYSFYTEANR
jgi:dTDP-4-amino-4,6-dideoxygalactose transaminase